MSPRGICVLTNVSSPNIARVAIYPSWHDGRVLPARLCAVETVARRQMRRRRDVFVVDSRRWNDFHRARPGASPVVRSSGTSLFAVPSRITTRTEDPWNERCLSGLARGARYLAKEDI